MPALQNMEDSSVTSRTAEIQTVALYVSTAWIYIHAHIDKKIRTTTKKRNCRYS